MEFETEESHDGTSDFATYEDYLDSQITATDMKYLQVIITIVKYCVIVALALRQFNCCNSKAVTGRGFGASAG